MNSSSSPNPDSLPASYTNRLLSSPQRYTNAPTPRTITDAATPPIVNLPTLDSIPQRVDSGYEDHLANKPLSTVTRDLSQVATEPRSTHTSTLSPNTLTHGLHPAPDSEGFLDSRRPAPLSLGRKTSASSLKPLSRTPSVKSATFNRGLGSAASSRVPSPIITAMGDVTPLPSPLLSGDSPGPWKRLQGRPPSRDAVPQLPTIMSESVLVTSNGESISSVVANQSKRRTLITSNGMPANNNNTTTTTTTNNNNNSDNIDKEGAKTKIHTRNRSISEYRPEHPNIPKRMSTVSGPRPGYHHQASLRREPHLSESRGLTPIEKPPSPPPSESSVTAGDSTSSLVKLKPNYEYFDAQGRKDGKLRRWRAVKSLGQGTFSRVVLATSHVSASEDEIEAEHSAVDSGLLTSNSTSSLDRKALVAVKVCEHGPKGGASEERVEMSLKRELEIMQSIHHPSLVDLKAWSIEPTRAILVLSYCPGGDLFDVATAHSDLLTPPLIRRIFAELVGAVQYLHECHIVHRDIKLENVLVNLTPQELTDRCIDWQTYPYSVTTLTDLGLSRRVTDDEKLTTRCGSEDYAAPELIMGMEYSGFATDAWSVGVLLYALLESRLPFDPPPGISDALRMRSRTSHRIARVEWQWIKYAGEDGDHEGDAKKFESVGMLGAMEVTEALLKRASRRWSLRKVAEVEWVKGGIAVEGGLKFLEADEGEEVL